MGETCTTCPYCGVGCGVIANVSAGKVTVSGDKSHPANLGRLCSKGSALAETISLDDRLLYPEIHGHRTNWDLALGMVADQFERAIEKYGRDSVALYVSGQILTEDYYVANKLVKGYFGTANIDTNSRLCMASSVVGHKRAFGADTVPGVYEDFEKADQIVLVGSNLAWCHPVLYQRIMAAKDARPDMRIIVIDPRRTRTADAADLWLPVAPDGDAALFNALLAYIAEQGHTDRAYIDAYVNGYYEALAAAQKDGVTAVEKSGLSQEQIDQFLTWFCEREKTVTIYSQGVNQSAGGTDKVNAILNCHLAMGRIGREGMGPFSVTGQPNAMGGREVGGLATMLAAHMDLDRVDHQEIVQNFWGSPHIATGVGLKAVELFQAVRDGKIKALWIMGTNPADSLPQAGLVDEALQTCPFVVVSDVVQSTDTLRHAHVRLPSLAWGEKSGTVTNSERRISRQRAFLPAPGEAKADWWQIAQVAQKLGFKDAFSFKNAAEVFREHAALSGEQNQGSRDFDISAYDHIDQRSYDGMTPFLWPKPKDAASTKRFFEHGGFFTNDRKANMLPIVAPERVDEPGLVLNTGRVRDHWHTMTRTGRSHTNSVHLAEPFVEIHPEDALAYGISDATLVRVYNDLGATMLRALITDRQRKGEVFAPIHWSEQFASNARIDKLVSDRRDPFSGQPALKMSRVEIAPVEVAQYGFLICDEKPQLSDELAYWAIAATEHGWRVEFALTQESHAKDLATLLHLPKDPTGFVRDATGARLSAVYLRGDSLHAALWVSNQPVSVSRSLVVDLLAQEIDAPAKAQLLAGRAAGDTPDKGPIICSCNQVGANDILAAIGAGAQNVDAIGAACGAGTNCGSCRNEVAALLEATQKIAAE